MEPSVSPYIIVEDSRAAIEFYKNAFGAEELGLLETPDGKVMHAAVKINGTTIMMNDDFPEYNDGKSSTPTALGGTPVTIHLTVPNVDDWFSRAVGAGATVEMPLEDQFWGDRFGVIKDPFGHLWSLGQPVKIVNPEDLKKYVAGGQ
ncbi:VOC family protein [Mycobacteroides immunogenum]|uniref:VOC family protein n=1 Tax=Mycobacteroides immunogenum TaxID=83262 RepID=UPI001969F186|nr:VOC family protein [Mycobacteroides immunogenum]